MTNDDLAQTMDTNDEWIQAGSASPSAAGPEPDETLVEMSVAAGGKALAASGLDADDIDLVLLATTSPPTAIPGLAPQVAHQLGIPRPGAFDVNAGCAGWCYALSAAADAIRAGSARNALVDRRRAAHRLHRT